MRLADLFPLDKDKQLDIVELENIVRALYDLSDVDMARVEAYEDAIERVKELFLSSPEKYASDELLLGIGKDDFVSVVEKDSTIVKLIDSRPLINKRSSRPDPASTNIFEKQSEKQSQIRKALSDPRLPTSDDRD